MTDVSLAEVHRIRRGVVWSVAFANFVAAIIVVLLLEWLLRDPDDESRDTFIGFVVISLLVFPAGMALGYRLFASTVRWISEDRRPTPAELRSVVNGPMQAATVAFGFWLLVALLIGGAELLDGGPMVAGVRDGGAILAAGVTSTALSYLLVERRGRPLRALALDGRLPLQSGSVGLRPRLVLAWALGSGVPLLAIAVGEIRIGPGDPRASPEAVIFLSAIGLVIGAVMTVAAVRSVAEPLAVVQGALADVRRGDLGVEIPVDDGGEIGRLQAGVNEMVAGLRERQRVADLFGRHVGTEVAARALAEGVGLGGERRDATAVFVDLRDSTVFASETPPEEVVARLNGFFREVVAAVTGEGGWVNKFEGDGAMCIFGVPASQPDHAARALRATRVLHVALERQGLRAAIGVSSGEVVAGNVGAEERYEYTVIGDAVNEASRLTDAAKDVPGNLLVSGASIERGGDEAAAWHAVAELQLRGRSVPTVAYTLRR